MSKNYSKDHQLTLLLFSIEELRNQLYQKVGQGRALLDPAVIELSQELDTLLNRFYTMTSSL